MSCLPAQSSHSPEKPSSSSPNAINNGEDKDKDKDNDNNNHNHSTTGLVNAKTGRRTEEGMTKCDFLLFEESDLDEEFEYISDEVIPPNAPRIPQKKLKETAPMSSLFP